MRISELFEMEDYDDRVLGLFHSLWHHKDRYQRLVSDGHMIRNHPSIKQPFQHRMLKGYVVLPDNPKLPTIKRTVAALERIVDKAVELTPDRIPESEWNYAFHFVSDLLSYLEGHAHHSAFTNSPGLSAFVHVGWDETPTEDMSNYQHLGNDSSGEMYVLKKRMKDPQAVSLGELYDALEHLVTIRDNLKKALGDNT